MKIGITHWKRCAKPGRNRQYQRFNGAPLKMSRRVMLSALGGVMAVIVRRRGELGGINHPQDIGLTASSTT